MATWVVSLVVAAASLFGVLVGGAVSYLSNAQRLSAENRRLWNERIFTLAVSLDKGIKEAIKPVVLTTPEDDLSSAIVENFEAHLEVMSDRVTELEFIAPRALSQSAAKMYSLALALSMALSLVGADNMAGDRTEQIRGLREGVQSARENFRTEVMRQFQVQDSWYRTRRVKNRIARWRTTRRNVRRIKRAANRAARFTRDHQAEKSADNSTNEVMPD